MTEFDAAGSKPHPEETELKMSVETKVGVWAMCIVVGVGLGFALPWLLQFIADWPLPFITQLMFLASFDAPVMVIGRPVILGLVGAGFAYYVTYSSAQLRISDARIIVVEGGESRTILREQVGGVYPHRGHVRIETPVGRVLFDDDVDGSKSEVASAFQKHGYPWEGV